MRHWSRHTVANPDDFKGYELISLLEGFAEGRKYKVYKTLLDNGSIDLWIREENENEKKDCNCGNCRCHLPDAVG